MTSFRSLILITAMLTLRASGALPAQQFDSTAAAQAARRLAEREAGAPEAAAAYAALLARAPGYALAWADRAEFERQRDSLTAARRYVERALTLRPRLAQALVVRGDLAGRDDLAGARADFLAAAEADTGWAVPLERVGRTYRWQGDCATAKPWFMRSLRRAPDWDIGRLQLEGCTTLRERATLLSELIAARPTVSLIRWRLSLPDSVVTSQSRLSNYDALLRLQANPLSAAVLTTRLQRARLLQQLGRTVEAAAACDSIFAAVTAQRDSLGQDGKAIMAGALLIRAESRAYPPNYRTVVADFELAEAVAGPRIVETIERNFRNKLTGYRVEAVFYEGDLPSLRALAQVLLDTAAYRRLGEPSASGANKRRLQQLLAIGRDIQDPRTRPGYYLLLAAHALPLDAREPLSVALRGGLAAIGPAEASLRMYAVYLEELMARQLVQDLGLRVGTSRFCGRSTGAQQAFVMASYEERLTKRWPLLQWGEFLADGRGEMGGWAYDPAQRQLTVQRVSGVQETWRVGEGRLTSAGRELQACR